MIRFKEIIDFIESNNKSLDKESDFAKYNEAYKNQKELFNNKYIDSKTKKPTSKLVWSWYGHGENQLHFTAEKEWWLPAGHINRIDFDMPADIQKFTLEQILEMLENGSN